MRLSRVRVLRSGHEGNRNRYVVNISFLGVHGVDVTGFEFLWAGERFVMLDEGAMSASQAAGSFNHGHAGRLFVRPVGKVHEAGFANESSNSGHDLRVVTLGWNHSGKPCLVRVESHDQDGQMDDVFGAGEEAVIRHQQWHHTIHFVGFLVRVVVASASHTPRTS